MDFKKCIMAAIAASIVMFLVDGLWWMVIFKDYYAHMRPPHGDESLLYHYVAELVLALVMAAMYPMGYKGGSPMMEGMKFGFWIGLVYSFPTAIHEHAAHFESLHLMLHNVLNGILIGILGGMTIGMIYGGKKASA